MEQEQTTIEVDINVYDDLLESERILEALQAAGVDNWEGYDCALELLRN